MRYVDEEFDTPEKLYYKMDYTIGMQIVDKQTIYYKLKNNKNICIINTELHMNGDILYAIIVENTYKSKQKWKIIDYKHISKAFMTRAQLINTYGIFSCDLPLGSKIKHKNFIEMRNKIKVTKQLIRNTHWSHIRIVQSKQNIDASNGNIVSISERRFKQLALKSLKEYTNTNNNLISIAQFKFRKNKYHIEKLLPVYIPEYNKYIAISFWYNQNNNQPGKTQVSGVCLDLVDIKNKANLIQSINKNHWLNITNQNLTINNLIIGQHKTNKKMKNIKPRPQKSKQTPTPMPYVPSKVSNTPTPRTYKMPQMSVPQMSPQMPMQMQSMSPQMSPCKMQQMSPQMSPSMPMQMQSIILPMQMQSVPMQSVPLLVHNSSIGSVGSIPSLCSMPMQSIPSIPAFQYQSVPVQNTIQNSLPNINILNIQQLQQNAQYFATFLRPNFCNNTANYNTQLNQNGYYTH
eukprot:216542_1